MVNVGICGCGFMGRTHFNVYDRLRNARVVALFDKSPKRRAGNWSDKIGNLPASWPEQVDMENITTHDSLDALLADPRVQLVDITLPTPLHAEASIKALRAAKHVLCEKPMALTFRDCQRVLKAAENAEGFFMVAQCLRFWPQYAKIKQLVASQRFGKPQSATLRRLAAAPDYSQDNWILDGKQSGGAIFDLHIHDVDFAAYLFGRPDKIYAQGTKGPSGGIDHVQALWDYGKDLLVTVEGGWCYPPGWAFQMSIVVRCEKATFEWNGQDKAVRVYHANGRIQEIPVKETTGWDEEVSYFVNCVEKRREPKTVTPKAAAEAIRLAEAECKSVTTGRPVPIR